MTRATFRAFKCRQGIHRLTFRHNQRWIGPACKDCHRSGPSVLPAVMTFKAGDIFEMTGVYPMNPPDRQPVQWIELPPRVLVMRPDFAIRVSASDPLTSPSALD